MIYLETKAGRTFWDLAVQMMIPLKAFEVFSDIVVCVDPRRVFLHPEIYTGFATRALVTEFGEEALKENGVLDAEGRLKTKV